MSILEEKLDELDASLRTARDHLTVSAYKTKFLENLDDTTCQIRDIILSMNTRHERYLLERLFFVQSSIRSIWNSLEKSEQDIASAAECINIIRNYLAA